MSGRGEARRDELLRAIEVGSKARADIRAAVSDLNWKKNRNRVEHADFVRVDDMKRAIRDGGKAARELRAEDAR